MGDKCSTRGCTDKVCVSWPLLNVGLCGPHYDNPTPQFAGLVAESNAPPDDFDISDEFDEPDGMWQTKEGKSIPYEELGDQHLLNILTMLGRSCHHYHGLEELEAEAAKRGLT